MGLLRDDLIKKPPVANLLNLNKIHSRLKAGKLQYELRIS